MCILFLKCSTKDPTHMRTKIEAVRLADILAIARSTGPRTRSLRLKKPLSDHPSRSTKRKNLKVRKQIFPHVDLGHCHPILGFVNGLDLDQEILSVMLQDFDRRILETSRCGMDEQAHEQAEDALPRGKTPSISYQDDTNEAPDIEARHRVRTTWPLEFSNAREPESEQTVNPRYAVPRLRPNRFLTDDLRERRKLLHRKWEELNRTHNWPSWLVCDDDHILTAEILCWIYPNILRSERDKREASITLEAVNVFFRGHKPSEDSPLYDVKEKTIARRVQRFLKEAEDWWKRESHWEECERRYDSMEASSLYPEGDEDYVVSLWRKRLDDEE